MSPQHLENRELDRQPRGLPLLDDVQQDLRYTLRSLRHDPSFTAVSLLILALAIGANIAVFSVVNTLLLRPLPFPNAHELAWIAPPPSGCGLSCATYSADAYEEFRAQSRVYQDVTRPSATPNTLATNPSRLTFSLRMGKRVRKQHFSNIEWICLFFHSINCCKKVTKNNIYNYSNRSPQSHF